MMIFIQKGKPCCLKQHIEHWSTKRPYPHHLSYNWPWKVRLVRKVWILLPWRLLLLPSAPLGRARPARGPGLALSPSRLAPAGRTTPSRAGRFPPTTRSGPHRCLSPAGYHGLARLLLGDTATHRWSLNQSTQLMIGFVRTCHKFCLTRVDNSVWVTFTASYIFSIYLLPTKTTANMPSLKFWNTNTKVYTFEIHVTRLITHYRHCEY